MKKVLILAFIGLGFLTQTTQAFHTTDLSDIYKENGSLSEEKRPAARAAALILTVNQNKTFNSLGKAFQITFENDDKAAFDAVLDTCGAGINKLAEALRTNEVSLLRAGTHFLFLDAEMNAAYFQVGTEEQLEAAEAAEFDVTPLFTQENEYATAQAFAAYVQEETVNAHIMAGIMRATENFADSIHKALVSSAEKGEISEEIVRKCETLGLTKEQEAPSKFWPFAGGFAAGCAVVGGIAAYLYFAPKND